MNCTSKTVRTTRPRLPGSTDRNSVALLTITVVCLIGSSCGRSDERAEVQGAVTIDGTPIAEGVIALEPMDGTVGPPTGALIKDGAYYIDADSGPLPGKYRVSIEGFRKTGRRLPNPSNPEIEIEETVPIAPDAYATGDALTCEIAAGANTRNFDLDSKGPPD